ncbi:MAG: hypothetical protein GC160_23590 [Acidobacteria bacterium]|nr:hypothetical protein [Acidobacteriota bacterium]
MDQLETPDRRHQPRNLCSELVEVVFEDQQGNTVSTVALVEDLSDQGLCVSSSLPVSPGRIVRIRAEGLESRGVVRYCELGEYSYLWGLELASGWRGEWQPHHELALDRSEEEPT